MPGYYLYLYICMYMYIPSFLLGVLRSCVHNALNQTSSFTDIFIFLYFFFLYSRHSLNMQGEAYPFLNAINYTNWNRDLRQVDATPVWRQMTVVVGASAAFIVGRWGSGSSGAPLCSWPKCVRCKDSFFVLFFLFWFWARARVWVTTVLNSRSRDFLSACFCFHFVLFCFVLSVTRVVFVYVLE